MSHYVTREQYAAHIGKTRKTVDNYVGRGLFEVFQIQGRKGWWIDQPAADAALAALPRTVARGGKKPFGPDARVRRIVVPEVATHADKADQ
jgi:hypothetical protein